MNQNNAKFDMDHIDIPENDRVNDKMIIMMTL